MKKKHIFLIMACFLIFISVYTSVFATTTSEIVNAMKSQGTNTNVINSTNNSAILYLLSRVFTLIQFIGTGISIIVVLKLGITYMMTSVEEKAEIKKKAVPIVIGSFFIVATVNIMKFLQTIVTTSLSSVTVNTPPNPGP